MITRTLGCPTAALLLLLSAIASIGRAAETPVPVRWRLQPGQERVYTYTFDQRSSARSKLDPHEAGPADEDTASGGGNVTVTATTAELATVALDHRVRAATSVGREVRPLELQGMRMKAKVGMGADGVVATNDLVAADNLGSFIETMFPVPRAPLTAGTPVRQSMKLTAPGVGDLTGEAVFSYQGQVRTNNVDCIHYKVDCQLQTTPPTGVKDPPGKGEFTAQIDCLFSPAQGCFVATQSEALLRFETRSQVEMRLKVRRALQLNGP